MKRFFYILIALEALLAIASCSTKQNTAATRRWQSFVTRYNVYFNAEQAYIEGRDAQNKGLKEDYTELLPVFGVGYEKQRSLGKSNFETAVTKCEKAIQLHSIKKKPVVSSSKSKTPQQKAYLSRKEFNPFLKNAWLLMGKAQFQKGDFSEAAATFSYITRFYAPEPDVVAEARIWLARCYAELDWFYDAEDVLQRLDRDTIPSRLSSERALTMADYLIRQEKLEDALPYLKTAVKKEKSGARKARLYYLLGQTYMALDRKPEAYKALSKCIAQSPAYEMTFHARILQTEALSTEANARSMVKRLKRMAKNDNNKEYIDQIYYAIGNIHLQQGDTLQAVSAYETGREKATQKGPETALLLLRLGGIYWEQRRFDKAQPCYTEAIGLLDKNHDDYQEITHRSKVLDALVPPTSAIHLQDSLQWLANADEDVRNAAIDRVIDELKKKEAEEKKARRDSLAEARRNNAGGDNGDALGGGPGNNGGPTGPGGMRPGSGSGDWYFYDAQQVMQGKQSFQKQWGKRKNEDDWRRSNRTVIASQTVEEFDYAASDSIEAAQTALRDSLAATGMSDKEIKRWLRDHEDGAVEGEDTEGSEEKELDPAEDPHNREYYLAQIPFTPEQKAESDSIIRESLFEAAVIEKDQLEDFDLAAETFARLERQFPDFSQMDEATYHLFLLYSRWAERESAAGRTERAEAYKATANSYREKMRTTYPDYAMTPVICDPDFERNARYGRELEDSLYTLTYDAYRRGDYDLVARNAETSAQKYPNGANRPKFIFVNALSQLGTVPTDSISSQLRDLAQKYPKSDVAEMAGMIVKGLESGRTIGSGGFDLGSLWSRRTEAAASDAAGSEEERALKADRDVPFVFLIAYETTDVATDDALLYDLARFNFSTYVYRSFDITKERDKGLTQFHISGFRDFDDVHNYAQRIFRDERLAARLRKTRIEIISEDNLRKLGSLYSFDDYRTFYDTNFAPLDINPDLPLEYEPEDDGIEYDESTPEAGVIYTPRNQKGKGEDNAGNDAEATGNAGRPLTDENGEPILDDDPLRPAQRSGDDYSDGDDEPARRQSDDEFFDDSASGNQPAKKQSDDEFFDDSASGNQPAKKQSDDEFFDDSTSTNKPAKKADDDDFIIDDSASSGKPAKKTADDDDFIIDDSTSSGKPAKKTADDDDFIIDDSTSSGKPAKKTADDDDFIIDDSTSTGKPAKKTADDDDFIIDDSTSSSKTAKTADDEEVYEE